MNGTRRPPVTRDWVASSYLGYLLTISDAEVFVFSPAGRRLGRATSVKSPRILVRSYRRALREETGSRVERAVADLAYRALPEDLRCNGGRR